ncbi:MAG TPA: hypothetical protein VE007_02800 [Thermoanaerobaculia bacterium]|nr:hypothetical protein [Thermoanaerobaculia bacterium]
MAPIVEIAAWRAKKIADEDVPMGAPPFALLEPCPGCGARRITTMVWRFAGGRDAEGVPFPRIEPHYLCRDGHVLYQDITDAPIPVSCWNRVMGRFLEADAT